MELLQLNRKTSFVNRKITLFLRKIFHSVRNDYIKQRNSGNSLPCKVGCGTLLHADEHRYSR